MNKANECTCPSGDGSLRWPCPKHPAVEQAGANVGHGHVFPRADGVKMRCGGPGLCSECTADASRARAALAQPSPAQAEQHWPKLEKPAQVGAIRFRAGLSSRLVVEAAQRLYEFESTPEKEAERIERLQAFREQCFEPLGAEFSKVLSENLVELSSEAKPEQAEAERPEGPTEDELEAAGLGYPLHKEEAVKLWYSGFRSEVITVLEAWEAIGHDIGMNPDKGELLDSLRYMLEKCEAHDAALARVAELEALMQMNFGELHTARNLLSRLSVSGVNVDAILGGQLQDLVIVPADATLEMVEALKRSLTVTNRGTLLNAGHALNASIAASPFAKKAPEPVMCPRCEGEGTLRTGIDESPSTICKRCDGVGTIAAAPGKEVPQAWLDVQAERRRQITAEGWTPEHDDLYCAAELPRAAAAYILNGANDEAPAIWSFSAKWWKPRDARSNYVRAGALILAEIERLDRAAPGKEVGHE